MENPHNTGHVQQFYIMNEGNFSTTNPIFFAYHSFIDMLLEYRITTFSPKENSTAATVIRGYLNDNFHFIP